MTKASEKIFNILIESDIDYIFGVPGGSTIELFDALYNYQDRIKVVLARHEQQASVMADAYGRLTGKPGVLIGQGAYIGTTGAFGILSAYLASSPMVVLTEFSEKDVFAQHGIAQCGIGEYGSFDLKNMLLSISKYVSVAVSPKEAVQGVQYAIKHAILGRPGPACVIMRRPAITGEVNEDQIPRFYETKGYLVTSHSSASLNDLEKAVGLLLNARSPVIISGNGVHISRAYEELVKLAELLSIPVATSYLGKSTIPETHPLSLGMMGRFGQPIANKVVGEADLILVVGCSLSPDDTCFENPNVINPQKQKIIQNDIEPRNIGWTYPVDMGIVGDAKFILRQMVELILQKVKKEDRKENIGKVEVLLKRKKEENFFEDPTLYAEDIPILPQRVVKELNNILDDSSMIFCDAGNSRLWMTHYFKTKSAGSFFGPGGIAGMGWSIPASITAKMLFPEKCCVAVCGDGGFAMTMHSLMTAVQYSVPIIVVIMNNSALGMPRNAQEERFKKRIIATEFPEMNFAEISKKIGCKGYRVNKPNEIASVLKKAIISGHPSVIDVVVSRKENVYKKILYSPSREDS